MSSPLSKDPSAFPESCVLDDLPQVKKDISELSKSCLLGKMLSAPLDIHTIISRTKADWRIVKGDVDYLEMGNGWILLRFANPQDLALAWSERPWHIQGDLLVLQPWKPSFDPYLEEIRWVDLWVRIPGLPTELLNFDSIANLLASNDIGALIKLDQRSLLRNKIRFARACVRVDIQGPLLEFAEISRSGDLVHRYVIWYEDFSSGCSFCGEFAHLINFCPLLNSPKKDITIQLMKNPKHHTLYKTLAKAAGQDPNTTTAEPARVVCVKPMHLSKKSISKPVNEKKSESANAAGLLPIPAGQIVNHGIIIKDAAHSVAKLPPPVHGKGKDKMLVPDPYHSSDSSDDEALMFPNQVSSLIASVGGGLKSSMDVGVPLMLSLPPAQLDIAAPVANEFQTNQLVIVTNQVSYSPAALNESENNYLLDDETSDDLGELNAFAENSFHSIHSDSSLVRQI